MGKFLPFCRSKEAGGSSALGLPMELHQRCRGTLRLSQIPTPERVEDLAALLDQIAGKIEAMEELIPAASLGPHFEKRRREILSQIELARSQATHLTTLHNVRHDRTEKGKTDEH